MFLFFYLLIFNLFLFASADEYAICSILRDLGEISPVECRNAPFNISYYCRSKGLGVFCNDVNEITSLSLGGLELKG